MYIRKRTIVIIACILAHIFIFWLGRQIIYAVRYNRDLDKLKDQIGIGAPEYWGSFTDATITSSDGKYTAAYFSAHMEEYNGRMIVVDVRDAETKEVVSSFIPARHLDFWGICWEEGTHKLWIQSGDTGIACYSEQDGEWILDKSAVRPDSIISKNEAESKKKKLP